MTAVILLLLFLCSFNRVSKDLFVSPIYTPGHCLHLKLYTIPALSSLSILFFPNLIIFFNSLFLILQGLWQWVNKDKILAVDRWDCAKHTYGLFSTAVAFLLIGKWRYKYKHESQ